MPIKSTNRVICILLVGFCVFLPTASAAPGDLDTTFASAGFVREIVSVDSVDLIRGTDIQPDGKIVVAGYVSYGLTAACGIARYNTDGSFDTSFDGDGKVIGEIGNSFNCYDVAIQSDGKIIAVGFVTNGSNSDFAVIRFNANGSLDLTFDGDGKVVTDFSGVFDYGYAVAVQSDDKIVVAGRTSGVGDDFAVARYHPNGSLDASFDGDGKVITNVVSGADASRALAIQADGKIIVAGNSSGSGSGDTNEFSLVRYNSNGSLDTSFNFNGKVLTDISGSHDNVNAIAIQPDGKIIAAGQSLTTNNNWLFSLARYNPDGSLDTSFDNDGKLTTSILNSNIAYSLSLQTDGKIVAAGSANNTFMFMSFAVVRFNSDGSPDTSFDGDGKLVTSVSSGDSSAYATAIQADGRIVAAGFSDSFIAGTQDFTIVRYNPNGSLDTSYDGDGKTISGIGSRSSSSRATAIQTDGKIVVVGNGSNGSNKDFAVVRYHRNGSLDSSFDGDGRVLTDFLNYFDSATSLAIQADGKIVVGGSARGGSALARYNTNGSLDTTFDGDGKIIGSTLVSIFAVAIQANGKIVTAGYGSNSLNLDFGLVRYNTDGSLDPSFDGDGNVLTDFSGRSDGAIAMIIQANGKIVAAGSSSDGTNDDFALARYNTDGSLDTSFDDDGKVLTDFSGNSNSLKAMALQADGKIVVAGADFDGSNNDFAIAKYNADGSLDASFDGDGKVTTSLSSAYDIANSVAVQTDGKIIAAGYIDNNSIEDFALVRYNTDGSLDNSYGTGGKAIFDLFRNERAFGLALDSIGRAVVAGELGGLFSVVRVTGDIAPPAVTVSVSGRFLRANGIGIFNGFITLTDSAGNTRIARTNPFGFYRFYDVPGGTAAISVSSKIFSFTNPTLIINLTDNIGDVDFTANE
jgi:uncharacterized delta-60 repeat protein